MKKFLFTASLSLLLIPFSFGQSEGPSLDDCVAWLHENTTYRNSAKQVFSSTYEKNGADPNLVKLTSSRHAKNSGWVEEYTFRWSDIASVEVTSEPIKGSKQYLVKLKVVAKNNESLIARKSIASGNAIIGKNIMNGSIIEKFLWFRIVVSSHPDASSAQVAANRLNKIAQRILQLSKGTKSGIDDSFFGN